MNDFIDLPHLPECLLGLPLETIHEIHSHTYHAIKADRQQRDNEWKLAVDHELTTMQSTADSYDSPAEAVSALIDWHVAVATDPVVGGQQCGELVAWLTTDGRMLIFADCVREGEEEGMTPLYAYPQPAVPEGWKLVPVQPTHRMLTEMLIGSSTHKENYTDFWERRYQAMLAASPKFGEEQ